MAGTAVYGTVRTVLWEDGGRKPSSYPIPVAAPGVIRRIEKGNGVSHQMKIGGHNL